MTVLICSIYHKFLKALVYKEAHHAKLALDMSKKIPLTSSEELESNDL